jgi:hypothetical protein
MKSLAASTLFLLSSGKLKRRRQLTRKFESGGFTRFSREEDLLDLLWTYAQQPNFLVLFGWEAADKFVGALRKSG